MKLATRRDAGLDGVRGVAVALMVVDHVSKTLPTEPRWLTLTVTRLSLPLFMVTLGLLLGQRDHSIRSRRFAQLVGCGLVTSTVFAWLGRPVPDVLLVIALTVPLWEGCKRWPEVMACLGLVQFVGMPVPWGGYQPGLLVLLICLGVLADDERWCRLGDWLPAVFVWMGQRPLAVYTAHVLMLPALQALLVVLGNRSVPGGGVLLV